jgi:hypothetical protein
MLSCAFPWIVKQARIRQVPAFRRLSRRLQAQEPACAASIGGAHEHVLFPGLQPAGTGEILA